MPKTISMSVDADGATEFTRAKELDGIFGGQGIMERVTDIRKADTMLAFRIEWLLGPYAGESHSIHHHTLVFGPCVGCADARVDDNTGTLWFVSYETAVAYEIVCLNAMREAGVSFGVGKA